MAKRSVFDMISDTTYQDMLNAVDGSLVQEKNLENFAVLTAKWKTMEVEDYAMSLGVSKGDTIVVPLKPFVYCSPAFLRDIVRYSPLILVEVSGEAESLLSHVIKLGWASLFDMKYWKILSSWNDQYLKGTCWYLPPFVLPRRTVHVEHSEKLFIYADVKGPHASDVVFFEGVPGSGIMLGEINDNGMTRELFLVPSLKTPSVVVSGLDSFRRSALMHYVSQLRHKNLADPGFYLTNAVEYSAWSYELHASQMSQVLSFLPSDTTIIAPADGIGLVARLWPGESFCGDLSISQITHKKVVCETMIRTVDRALATKPKNPVIILSYCQQFLTFDEMNYIRSRFSLKLPLSENSSDVKELVPVICIEASDAPLARSIRYRLGPGVYSTVEFSDLHAWVKDFKIKTSLPVWYSENLLNTDLIFPYMSDVMMYYSVMRPGGSFGYTSYYQGNKLLPGDSISSTVFCRTLQDCYKAWKHGYSAYYYPIGRILSSGDEIKLIKGNSVELVLQCREVYCVEDRDLLKYLTSKGCFLDGDDNIITPPGQPVMDLGTRIVSKKYKGTYFYMQQSIRVNPLPVVHYYIVREVVGSRVFHCIKEEGSNSLFHFIGRSLPDLVNYLLENIDRVRQPLSFAKAVMRLLSDPLYCVHIPNDSGDVPTITNRGVTAGSIILNSSCDFYGYTIDQVKNAIPAPKRNLFL